jgi:hypothetical protein
MAPRYSNIALASRYIDHGATRTVLTDLLGLTRKQAQLLLSESNRDGHRSKLRTNFLLYPAKSYEAALWYTFGAEYIKDCTPDNFLIAYLCYRSVSPHPLCISRCYFLYLKILSGEYISRQCERTGLTYVFCPALNNQSPLYAKGPPNLRGSYRRAKEQETIKLRSLKEAVDASAYF